MFVCVSYVYGNLCSELVLRYKRGIVLNLGAPSSMREAAVVRLNKERTVHLPDLCHYTTEHYCRAYSCVCVYIHASFLQEPSE